MIVVNRRGRRRHRCRTFAAVAAAFVSQQAWSAQSSATSDAASILAAYWLQFQDVSGTFEWHQIRPPSDPVRGRWVWRTDGSAGAVDILASAAGGPSDGIVSRTYDLHGVVRELVYSPRLDGTRAPRGHVRVQPDALWLAPYAPMVFHDCPALGGAWHDLLSREAVFSELGTSPEGWLGFCVEEKQGRAKVVVWVDPSRGNLPVLQQVIFARTPSSVRTCRVEDASEVAPGLWYPRVLRVNIEPVGEPNNRSAETVWRFSEVVVNAGWPDSRFTFDWPPGTKVSDGITGAVYVVPADDERGVGVNLADPKQDDAVSRHLDSVARLSTELPPPQGVPGSSSAPAPGRRAQVVGAAIGALAAGAALLCARLLTRRI